LNFLKLIPDQGARSSLIALAGKFIIANKLAVSVDDLRPIVIVIAILVPRMRKGETKLGCYYAYYSMARSTCSDAHSAVISNKVKNPSQKKDYPANSRQRRQNFEAKNHGY